MYIICQLVQGISKLAGCAHPKVCKSYLLNASGRSKICQKTPLSPPGALCCSETAYHILTKKKSSHSQNHQKIIKKSHQLFSSPLVDARLKHPQICVGRAVRRRPGTGLKSCHHYAPWKNFFPTLRQDFTNGFLIIFLEWLFFSYNLTDFFCIHTWSKGKWKILSDKILPGHTNRPTVTFLQDVNVSKKSFKFWTSKSSKSPVNRCKK